MYRTIQMQAHDANLRLSWDEALPNATSAISKAGSDAASLIRVGANPGFIFVWARTEISLAESATIAIEPVAYADNTPGSAAQPFPNGSLVHTITGDSGGSTIPAGSLLAGFAIDPLLLDGKPYIGLKYTCSGDQHLDKVSAIFSPFAPVN